MAHASFLKMWNYCPLLNLWSIIKPQTTPSTVLPIPLFLFLYFYSQLFLHRHSTFYCPYLFIFLIISQIRAYLKLWSCPLVSLQSLPDFLFIGSFNNMHSLPSSMSCGIAINKTFHYNNRLLIITLQNQLFKPVFDPHFCSFTCFVFDYQNIMHFLWKL